MNTHRLRANRKVQGFGHFLKREIPTIAKILIPHVSQIDRLNCLHAKKFTWNCWLIALSKMLHNNWTHKCFECWDTVTAPSWQRRFHINVSNSYLGLVTLEAVMWTAQVAPLSTKVQKISRKIFISKIFSCQDDNAEEDIDFINMPSQIPISDDKFFFYFLRRCFPRGRLKNAQRFITLILCYFSDH